MDLHFCSRCGISIPQSEIDSGSAAGAGGKMFCAEHRSGASVAVAENPRGGVEDSSLDPGLPPLAMEEPELLFCANCRVSIPEGDAKSGRAHREFGSLLCAGCSKADPGERAARREAVEAEMAADVDAQDPVVARRCSVCSAAVPYGQIVTGKAKVDGNRVTCERCRVASLPTHLETAKSAPSGGSGWGLVAAVVVVCAGLGYLGTRVLMDKKEAPVQKETANETAQLRVEMDKKLKDLDTRLNEALRKASDPDQRLVAERERVAAEMTNLRQVLSDARAEATRSDVDLAQRIAKIEGQLQSLADMMRGLAARGSSGPAPMAPPNERAEPPTNPPPRSEGPSKPEVPQINPVVVKLCKDLLDSPDDGIRFTAATELTTMKDPAAIPSLVKALGDDKHYFVRRGCARALGVMKAWLAIPALIKSLEDKENYVALAANIALQNITGNDFGVTQDTPVGQRKTKAAAAMKWWEKNKDSPPDGVSLHPITD